MSTKEIGVSISILVIVVLAILGGFDLFGEGENIHPIGDNATYIPNESCTINTPLNRSEEELRVDAEMCINYHKTYRELDSYDQGLQYGSTIVAKEK
tara:strand:- start:701 stop:991 length:291 start_codon:yes stop_codon:yes gene_type:complete